MEANTDDKYLLRFNDVEGAAIAAQLCAPGASPYCEQLGWRLQAYFKPSHPDGCADCGGPGADCVSPESVVLHEVWLSGMRAHASRQRRICRTCLRRYHLTHGNGDPFPQDRVLEPVAV